jgi:hypothetical protein
MPGSDEYDDSDYIMTLMIFEQNNAKIAICSIVYEKRKKTLSERKKVRSQD